jgi:hypothetical protein
MEVYRSIRIPADETERADLEIEEGPLEVGLDLTAALTSLREAGGSS